MFHRKDAGFLSLHGKTDFRGVAQRIAQGIYKTVGTFLVDFHQPPVPVGGMQHAQAVAWLDERLHVLPVRPRVDIAVFFVGKAVYHATEYLLAVYLEYHGVHAVAVAYPVHMVVSTDTHAYQPPGGDRVRGTYRKRLAALFPVHRSPARLREQHDAFGAGGNGVFHPFHKERQRVDVISRGGLNHIQMQVRAEGVARIAAERYHLPCLYRIFPRFGSNLHFPALLFVLQRFHPAGYIAHKSAEVAVDSRIAAVVGHIEHVARPVRYADTRYIPVGQGADRLAYGSAGLEIEPAMEMVGAYLAEIPGESDRKIEGGNK